MNEEKQLRDILEHHQRHTPLDSSSYNPSPVTQLTYTEINSISPVEGEVNWEMGPTYNQQPQN